jgi:hypothetical protein
VPAHTGPGISLRIALARIRKLPIASQDQSAPSKLDTFGWPSSQPSAKPCAGYNCAHRWLSPLACVRPPPVIMA